MKKRHISHGLVSAGLTVLITAAAVVFTWNILSCAPGKSNIANQDVDAVAIDLVVQQDDFLGFTQNAVIGNFWFSDTVGLVGTPVQIVAEINEFQRIPQEVVLDCEIKLADPTVTKVGDFMMNFTLDERKTESDLIIPQVITIPTIIEYEVTVSAVNPNDPTEKFIATLNYQFLVNKGTPAT